MYFSLLADDWKNVAFDEDLPLLDQLKKVISKIRKGTTFRLEAALRYSQTYSKYQLYKTTTSLRRPMLSPPKQIPMQSWLYKTTNCPTQPATIFFVYQTKKPV